MSKRPEPSAFETLSRLTIMLGSATVAGMAFYVYGPPPEKAAAAIDQLASRVQEMMGDEAEPTGEQPQPADTALPAAPAWPEPNAFAAPATAAPTTATQASAAPPLADPQAAPAPGAGDDSRLASLTARLAQLGASQVQIKPWGAGGTFHRCCFNAPVAGSGGFQRHFEAIEATALGAVTAALAELEQSRRTAETPTFWR